MIQVSIENDFLSWRVVARQLLQNRILPHEVLWTMDEQSSLFVEFAPNKSDLKTFKVSVEFLELAEIVSCVDDDERWALLYRLLFRLTHENRNLLEIESDDDVRQALLHSKAIRRDIHKMHAFVRFKRVESDIGEMFIAWYEPQHFIVKKAAPFFARRFGAMRFTILTPKECAHWDLENLIFTEGVSAANAPQADEMERFWQTYYASIFNPARLKVKAMKAEMPIHFWKNLPEAELLPDLIRQAEQRTKEMINQKALRAEVIKKLSQKS
ncbi:MAG: TIGR03915 family putative DNA repair protein [Pyrinomonadaceae bacterium]